MSTDTKNEWIASDVFDGGTSFGDEQYGDDLSRRYTRTAPDGTLLTVDYTVAVMAREDEDPDETPVSYWVDDRTDYMQGISTNQPDSMYADVEYGEGSYRRYETPEDAQAEAVRMMLSMSADYIDWDGM